MNTATDCSPQEETSPPLATRWNLDWRPVEADDVAYFDEYPNDRFLLRPWCFNDDRHAVGKPPIGTHYYDLRDMELITIAFRAGCRLVCFYCPIDHTAWDHAGNDARFILNEIPELGVDGGRPRKWRP